MRPMDEISFRCWIFIAMLTELRHLAVQASQSPHASRPLPLTIVAKVLAASKWLEYCTVYMCDRISVGMSTPRGQSPRHSPH